jgi:PAS domain S-box-containing protein
LSKVASDDLEHREERFRLLVSSIRDYAIFMLDEQGRVQTWNVGAERLKGYEAAEIIGQSYSRFYSPEDLANGRPAKLLRAAVQDGRVEDEGWRIRKDGSRFWADVVITALRDDAGRLKGFAKVTRDLSDRRAAEQTLRQSEQRFRLLVDSVKDYSIFMLDPDGIVATWNSGAERIKGYSPAEIIGKHFSRFYPPEDIETGKDKRELEIASSEGRFEEEGWRVRKDGSRFWANVVLTAIRGDHGELLGFAKVTRDLTDRKLAEEERVRLAGAHEAVRLRDEFLAVAGHEFKTPLQSLKLQLELVDRALSALEPAVVQRLAPKMETMRRQVDRLSTLSGGLLDLSAMQSGKLPLRIEYLELAPTIRSIVERLANELARSRCEVRLDLEAGVGAKLDASRFDQILVNLLTNAAKYGAGQPIVVSARAEGDLATVAVADRGIGIPDKDLPRIFEKFERAVSPENYGGLGLGLYIARQLVEALGGTIEATSQIGRGSTFKVQFKRAPTPT